MIRSLSASAIVGSWPHVKGTMLENVDAKVVASHSLPSLRAALRSRVGTWDFETGNETHPTSRFLEPNTVLRPLASRLG